MKVTIEGDLGKFDDHEILSLIKAHEKMRDGRRGPFATLALWARRYSQRRQMARDLETFTEEVLKDFGLTRHEAREMAYRPFWRA